ncbi:MAG: hypothetical protein ACE141_15025 [Bryobacteraceae bacterium]
MLSLALAFFFAGVLVLRAKRPAASQCAFRLFRVDEIAMSVVLFVLSGCMVALALFA